MLKYEFFLTLLEKSENMLWEETPVNSPHHSHPFAMVCHFSTSPINCNHNILISFYYLQGVQAAFAEFFGRVSNNRLTALRVLSSKMLW